MSAMWIPIIGAITGLVIPLAAFMWSYIEGKEKRETILEIARTVDDPDKVNELLAMLEEKKSDPVDYRRGGVITLFVGAGIYMLGAMALWRLFQRHRCLGWFDRNGRISRRLSLPQYNGGDKPGCRGI